MKQIRITESELKDIISEAVIKALNEGTTSHDDGMSNYMGTGSPESQERMKKIKSKKLKEPLYKHRNRFNWDLSRKVYRYNGSFDDDTVYDMVNSATHEAAKILEELSTKLEKVNGHSGLKKDLKELISDIRLFSIRGITKNQFKRDYMHEPVPDYNEE